MRFSIIVPIYNKEEYLEKCLSSIMLQTFEDFECLMIDDGSTDKSIEICDYYMSIDDRFKVIHKVNGGLVSARKEGAKHARGEYVINVDGDDFIEAGLLEHMSKIIQQCNPDSICYGYQTFGGNRIDSVINPIEEGYYKTEKLFDIKKGYLYDKETIGINSGTILFNICTKCVKQDIYLKCQEKVSNDIVSGEDTVFTMYWLEEIKSLYFLDYDGYYYRQDAGSIEHQFNINKVKQLLHVYDALLAQAKKHNTVDENSVNMYLFYRTWFYLCGQAIYAKKYKVFKRFATSDEMSSIRSILNTEICKPNIQAKIKYYLTKNGKWMYLYIISRIYFRKRLEL